MHLGEICSGSVATYSPIYHFKHSSMYSPLLSWLTGFTITTKAEGLLVRQKPLNFVIGHKVTPASEPGKMGE